MAHQCSDCARGTEVPSGVVTSQVKRLVAAIAAEEAGRASSKADRRQLRSAVERAGLGLRKVDLALAWRLAAEPGQTSTTKRSERRREDWIAGIWQPRVVVQNVGRGKRS